MLMTIEEKDYPHESRLRENSVFWKKIKMLGGIRCHTIIK